MGAGISGKEEGAVLMVGPAVPVSKYQIEFETMYWYMYRNRRSGSAECIMTLDRERDRDGRRGGECCQ